MINLKTGLWSVLVVGILIAFSIGCSGGVSNSPTLPDEGFTAPTDQAASSSDPLIQSQGREIWASGNLVINEEDMTVDVLLDRTLDAHYDVTWVKDICANCIVAKLANVDLGLRIFTIELHTRNPTVKIGRDVRFIVDVDDTGEYDFLDPDNYTKLHDPEGNANPFRALATEITNRSFMPAANHVEYLDLYISESHVPLTNIPFIVDVSYPGRCQEPYMITDIVIDGEFPPGGGGTVTVDLIVWDTQQDWGEVWLRTGGIFTAPGTDIMMTPGVDVGEDGKMYSATFGNTYGGGSGLTPILIEAFTDDTGVEPFAMCDFARIFADPGGQSAIAGEVFNAINITPANTAVVTITNTGGGGSPLPYTVTDGTYYVTVPAGTYNVSTAHNSYFVQDTIYDVDVPADTVVYVCFGLAPKYLWQPEDALASISGHIRDSDTGEPIEGAQATLDGGTATGGVIQSRSADENGHYCFYAIPTAQQDNWTVHAFHPSYIPDDISDIPSDANKSTPQVDFDLDPVTGDAIWLEDFESGPSNVGTKHDWFFESVNTDSWPGDGTSSYHNTPRSSDVLWRVWDPVSNPVQDVFYILETGTPGETICWLPPDDTSEGYIPDPWGGHAYLWYGEEVDTTPGGASEHGGSFIDEWNSTWTNLGGRSTNSYNAGTALSEEIDLSGYDELTLTFQSYWEIEAVDPSIQYDACDVLISTNGTTWNRLDRLNPDAEPIPDSGNAAIAYTSTGFNQAAAWAPSVIDISSYGGDSIWLRFDFDTRDSLYNGFRGWTIDDVAIWDYATD